MLELIVSPLSFTYLTAFLYSYVIIVTCWTSIFLNFWRTAKRLSDKEKFSMINNVREKVSSFWCLSSLLINETTFSLFDFWTLFTPRNYPPAFRIFKENPLCTAWCCWMSNTVSLFSVSKLEIVQMERLASRYSNTSYCISVHCFLPTTPQRHPKNDNRTGVYLLSARELQVSTWMTVTVDRWEQYLPVLEHVKPIRILSFPLQ